ncbi:MAG: M48 family metallopeptidase [Sphaerochaeta sp.]|jgi:hypothetical protein|uniref:M48 family metallopeptidase n=1 Tax=Sphaerochaeta sp. TaxID=1972642 RepID=UPI002FC7709F
MKTEGKVEQVSYRLVRRRRSRNITVRVLGNGVVRVNAPYGVSRSAIEQVLRDHKEKLEQLIQNQQNSRHTYTDGERFLFAGAYVRLDLYSGDRNAVTVEDQRLKVTYTGKAPDPETVCRLLKEFYRHSVAVRIEALLPYWAERLGLEIPRFSVRDTRARWGSCTAKGTLHFSLRSQVLNDEQLSYLVLHEMAHLVHFNHSKQFHALLAQHMCSYRTIQKQVFSVQQESQLCF